MPPAGRGNARGTSAQSRRRRAVHDAEGGEGGAERWLVTYADMLTLLLVLFIVLFSISVVNTSKYISLKTSLGSVFGDGKQAVLTGGDGLNDHDSTGTGQQLVLPGMPVTGSGASQPGAAATTDPDLTKTYDDAKARTQLSDFRAIEKSISRALSRAGRAGSVKFAITKRGLVITVITNALVFPGNSADLLSRGQEILATVAAPLAKDTRSIEVDGYTNQEKVSTDPYPSGWELSSARASAVVRYLTGRRIAESRLSAVGYSDQRPLYPPSDPRSVTLNRRVEIVVLSNLAGAPASH